jgi:hypothetical protein
MWLMAPALRWITITIVVNGTGIKVYNHNYMVNGAGIKVYSHNQVVNGAGIKGV